MRKLVACLAIVAFLACGEEGQDRSDTTDDSGDPAQAAHVDDWPCEEKGYPCTWEEVSAEVTERGFALADRALERFEPGAASEVVDWLEAQADVVEAHEEDPSLIWFRVEGGRRIMVQGPLPPGPFEVKLQGRTRGTSFRDPEVRLAGVGSVLTGGWSVASSWFAAMRSEPLPLPGVTGRDRNEDSRVNQRDERKALILESIWWEDCYEAHAPKDLGEEARQSAEIDAACERGEVEYESVGEKIEAILEESPAYRGNVRRLRDQEVDFDAIASWVDYDVIHIDGHGSRNTMCLGTEIAWPGHGKLRGAAASRRGVDPTVFRAGRRGPKKSVWCVNHRFFRTLYPKGLDRTLIFMNGCSTLGHPDRSAPPMASQLLGEQSMYVGWGGVTNRWYEVAPPLYSQLVEGWTGKEAVRSLPIYLDQEGDEYDDPVYAENVDLMDCNDIQIGPEELALVMEVPPEEVTRHGGVEGWCRHENEQTRARHPQEQLEAGEVLGTRGSDMRIREVVKLFHPPSPLLGAGMGEDEHWALLEDGDDLGRLLVGALDDGEDDFLRVTVAIEALKLDEPPSTLVHLELDGEPIGEPWSFESARQVDYRPHGPDWAYRLDLDGPRIVEVGKDLEAGREYELEAVVDLPEGGQSRYAVHLSSEICRSNMQGDLEGNLSGSISRTFEWGDRQHSVQLRFHESGGPTELVLETGQRKDYSVTLSLVLDRLPEAGARLLVEDSRVESDSIRGRLVVIGAGVGGARDRVYGWHTGKATVSIHKMNWDETVPDRTGRRGWICGEIGADLVGWAEPPPGSSTIGKVPHNLKAEFRAELIRVDRPIHVLP